MLDGANHRHEEVGIQCLLIQQGRNVGFRDDHSMRLGSRAWVAERQHELIFEDPVDLQLPRQDFVAVPVR